MSETIRGSRSEWPLRRVLLPPSISAGLWLTDMPGRSAPLTDFVSAAQDVRITRLVCLVDPEHIASNSPDYAQARSDNFGFLTLVDFPIADYGVPENPAAFEAFVMDLAEQLRQGERLVIHCAAGIGRTGLAAVMTLRALGLDAQDALAAVRDAGSEPETPEQMAFAMEKTDA